MRFTKKREDRSADVEDSTMLVRTWFANGVAWQSLLEAVRTPSGDGFIADLCAVDDQSHSGAAPAALAHLVRQSPYSIVVVADERSMTDPEVPLLVVRADGSARPQTFRVVGSQLWAVENNLALANMEWESFADFAEQDGVFRGFD